MYSPELQEIRIKSAELLRPLLLQAIKNELRTRIMIAGDIGIHRVTLHRFLKGSVPALRELNKIEKYLSSRNQ